MTKAKPLTANQQYQMILECRSSGLSDYQWCMEHGIKPGTFYNWVRRLRKKACYDIPPAVGRGNYKPVPTQEVVPLLILDEEPETPSTLRVEQNTCIGATVSVPVVELNYNGVSIRIANDINPHLLSQILEFVGGHI